jgi:hypothetical protein
VQCAADLIWSPVFRTFPHLRVALSGDRLPSEVFNEHVLTCFIDDAVGMEVRHHLNPDHIHWECDYPHSDSTWPEAPERAMRYLDGLPRADIDRITHLNAMRNFRYDPFSVIPREQCTVGALRAQATDVDTAPGRGTGKFRTTASSRR